MVVVGRGCPDSLGRLESYLQNNCGVITRLGISLDVTNELIGQHFYICQLPLLDEEDLRIHINQSLETPQQQSTIELQSAEPINHTLLSTYQQMDLNMPTNFTNWELLLSLLFYPLTSLEDLLSPQEESKESFVQQPTETTSRVATVQMGVELPLTNIRIAPSIIENSSSDSQPTEPRNENWIPNLLDETARAITHRRMSNLIQDRNDMDLNNGAFPAESSSLNFSTGSIRIDSIENRFRDLLPYHNYTVYHCVECGSPDIEISAWINPHTDEVISAGEDGPTDDCWCNGCSETGPWTRTEIESVSYEQAIEEYQRRRRQ
jgi:hypothetical protein